MISNGIDENASINRGRHLALSGRNSNIQARTFFIVHSFSLLPDIEFFENYLSNLDCYEH